MPSAATSTAVKSARREQNYFDQQPTYSAIQRLPQVWEKAAEQFGDIPALVDPHAKPEVSITFRQLKERIHQFAGGLQSLGIQPESHVALFAENQPRWFIADQGIMAAGAIDIVRSAQAERDELLYILENSDATVLVIENQKALDKLKHHLETLPIELVILLADEEPQADAAVKTLNFEQVMAQGAKHGLQPVKQGTNVLATLLYTSGTTGKPKGVMLTHANLLHQVNTLGSIIQPQSGDRLLSILPTWHIYERACEYFALSQGVTMIYTDLRHFKQDLKHHKPQYFISVPRLLVAIQDGVDKQIQRQSINRQRLARAAFSLSRRYVKNRRIVHGLSLDYPNPSALQRLQARTQMLALAPAHRLADRLVYQTIRAGMGTNFNQIINGGGSLSLELDQFFEIIGVDVIVGYGLTETSPVLTAR